MPDLPHYFSEARNLKSIKKVPKIVYCGVGKFSVLFFYLFPDILSRQDSYECMRLRVKILFSVGTQEHINKWLTTAQPIDRCRKKAWADGFHMNNSL